MVKLFHHLLILLFLTQASAQLTDAIRQKIVAEHNAMRLTVNTTNMLQMAYDMKLECVGQAYLATLVGRSSFSHNSARTTDYAACGGSGYVGENWYSAGPVATTSGEKGATYMWCDYPWSGCSERNAFLGTCSGVTGHYTQVMWANSALVGCGYTTSWGTICNYSPGGNYQGQSPYTLGLACSACPTSAPYCVDGGLCSAVSPGVATCASYQCPNGTVQTSFSANCSSSGCQSSTCCGSPGGGGNGGVGGSNQPAEVTSTPGKQAIAAAVLVPLAVLAMVTLVFVFREPIKARLSGCLPEERPLLITTLALAVVALALALTAVSGNAWVRDPYLGGEGGLWKFCEGGMCVDTIEITRRNRAVLQAVRAFAILTFIALLGEIVCVMMLLMNWLSDRHVIITYCIHGFGWAAMMFAFVSPTLYAAYYNDELTGTLDLGWTYAAAWLTWLFSLFVAIAGFSVLVSRGPAASTKSPLNSSTSTATTGSGGGGGGGGGVGSSGSAMATTSSPVPPRQAGAPAGSPNPWEKMYDDNSKAYYYYNKQTGESQWDPPAGFA